MWRSQTPARNRPDPSSGLGGKEQKAAVVESVWCARFSPDTFPTVWLMMLVSCRLPTILEASAGRWRGLSLAFRERRLRQLPKRFA
jgi:hypothetical protein